MSLKVEFGNGGTASQISLRENSFALTGQTVTEMSPATGVGGVITQTSATAGYVSVPNGGTGMGGTVNVGYEDNTFTFTSTKWNGVKNAFAVSDTANNVSFKDIVHVDVDFTAVQNGSTSVTVENVKRGNIDTGASNDKVSVSLSTNDNNWQNVVNVNTGAGDDSISFTAGKKSGVAYITDGRFTTVDINAGAGNDSVDLSGVSLKSATIHGGSGNDTLVASKGVDTFVYDAADGNSGYDVIKGFQVGTDHLQLNGLSVVDTVVLKGNLLIALSDGGQITLVGVTQAYDDGLFLGSHAV